MEQITSFSGEFFFLSNFFPQVIRINNLDFASSEHAFVSFKTTELWRREYIAYIIETPGQAKRYGRSFPLRPDWEDIKVEVMERIIDIKFDILPLAKALVATEDAELIEGNTWGDKFWGKIFVNGQWVGDNNLGNILMRERDKLNGGNLNVIN